MPESMIGSKVGGVEISAKGSGSSLDVVQPTNHFGALAMGQEVGESSQQSGLCVRLGVHVIGPSEVAKFARPSNFATSRGIPRPIDLEKGPLIPKKGLNSSHKKKEVSISSGG